MRTVKKSKGSIRFAFKESMVKLEKNPKKMSLILLHFNYGKKRFKYSTGFYSCFADWDAQKQRIRNKAHILDRDFVNDYFLKLESELQKEVSRLNAEGLPIKLKNLKEKLDLISGKILPAHNDFSFYDYYNKFLERKSKTVKAITLRSHNQTKKQIQAYQKNIDFDDIDYAFYYGFKEHLCSIGFATNTIGKHIKNLKVMMNSAFNDGMTTNLIFKQSDFKVPKEQTTAIYLDEEEIKRLHELDLKAFPKLERARDIFLIGCYTGQRISDCNGLTEQQIKKIDNLRFFHILQEKTGKEVYCPITKEVDDIMNSPRNNGLPPLKMNTSDINEYIKLVGKKAKIVEETNYAITRGGIKTENTVPKYQLITTHTARRSFCTNLYKKKMPIVDIMHFSGHSGEKVFYTYIRIEKEQRSLHIAKSGFFNL